MRQDSSYSKRTLDTWMLRFSVQLKLYRKGSTVSAELLPSNKSILGVLPNPKCYSRDLLFFFTYIVTLALQIRSEEQKVSLPNYFVMRTFSVVCTWIYSKKITDSRYI